VASSQSVIPRDTTYTVSGTFAKLKKQYPDIAKVEPRTHPQVNEQRDVVYQTFGQTLFGKRELHADVFLPVKGNSRPAIVLVHGGGWRAGDKSMNTPMAQELALRGIVAISIEYRLSLEAKYPAAVQDVKSAVAWVRQHAAQLGVNPHAIAVGGASAGGQLAALTGATNGVAMLGGEEMPQPELSTVQAVVDMDGILDFMHPESLALKRNANNADVFWFGGDYNALPNRWKEASPVSWIKKNAPPFLFVNSSQTRFHAGYQTVVSRLDAAGIYNEVHVLKHAPHSYWLFDPWFAPTVDYITMFLNKVFNKN